METAYRAYDIITEPVIVTCGSKIIYSNRAAYELYKNVEGALDTYLKLNRDAEECYRIFNTDSGKKFFHIKRYRDNDKTVEFHKDITDENSADTPNHKHILPLNEQFLMNYRRLAAMMEQMDSAVMLEDEKGNIVYVNSSFLETAKLESDILLKGSLSSSTVHSGFNNLTGGEYKKAVQEFLDSGEKSYTKKFSLIDGREYRCTFSKILIDNQEKGFIWGLDSENKYDEMLNKMSEVSAVFQAIEFTDSIGICMQSHLYSFTNSGFSEITGIQTAEFSKEKFVSLFNENDQETVIKALNSTFNSGTEFCIKTINGEKWIQMSSVSSNFNNNSTLFIVITDISKRKSLEDQLRRSEEKFRTMFEKNSAAMITVNPDSLEMLELNESASSLLGVSPNEIFSLYDLAPEVDIDRFMFQMDVLSNNNAGTVEIQAKLASGVNSHLQIHSTKVRNGVEKLLLIIHDISERIKYEKQLSKMNKNLESLVIKETEKRRFHEQLMQQKARMAEMGEMIGVIAHQWRQPLNALGLIIQDLEDASEFGELNTNYVKAGVSDAMKEICYMTETIEDFRNFYSPKKDSLTFNAAKAVKDVVGLLLPQLINNGISFSITDCGILINILNKNDLNYEPSYCPSNGKESEFKQVLLSIISNSIDALKSITASGKQLSSYISTEISADENDIFINIVDNGGGIPTSVIDKIFDPYFTTKGDKNGTGIGLYMSKNIIENNMNGQLSAKSCEGSTEILIQLKKERG